MEKLSILFEFSEKESQILDLEGKLMQEISFIKDLEQKVLVQNSELQSLMNLTETSELNLVFPDEFLDSSIESKEITVYVIFYQKTKINCKEEIIKVLKNAIKDLFELKKLLNKEIFLFKKDILKACPGILNINIQKDLEDLENESFDWLKTELEEIANKILEKFCADIEVIQKQRKSELYKCLFLSESQTLYNFIEEINEDEGFISVFFN